MVEVVVMMNKVLARCCLSGYPLDRGVDLIQYFEIPRVDDIVPLEIGTVFNLIYNNMISQTMTPRLEKQKISLTMRPSPNHKVVVYNVQFLFSLQIRLLASKRKFNVNITVQ